MKDPSSQNRSSDPLEMLLASSLESAKPITRRIFGRRRVSAKEVEEMLRKIKVATIATVNRSGAPHAVPVSFIHLKGKIFVNTSIKSSRYRNHIRDGGVALTMLDGYSAIVMKGRARVAGRTIGMIEGEVGRAFLERYGRERRRNPDAVMIEISPTKIFALRRG